MCQFGRCETTVTQSRVSLSERRSKITFLNPEQRSVRRVQVDGCAITDGMRCDYLLIDHTGHEHYVELKGSDVSHALDQIMRSIEQLSVEARTHPKSSYVSSTRCPLFSTDIQCHKLKFKRFYNSSLQIRNGAYEVDIPSNY
jgi:hypothetical protein